MKIGDFKKRFFTNCDKMLNVVNFKNGGTCVHLCILDVILRVLVKLLLVYISAYLRM